MLLFLLALACTAASAPAQSTPVRYSVEFPNAVHHEARIRATFTDVPSSALQLRMSRTSPGRYALHEFAKNVYDVRFTSGAGNVLQAARPNLHQWDVGGHDGTVTVEYTLYGDQADGTYASIGPTGALLNIPATFLWARGLEERPVEVRFTPPPDSEWRVATQLLPGADPFTFTAPDFQHFMDSPTMLGRFALHEWEVEAGDQTARFQFALDHQGTPEAFAAYMEWVEAVVHEEIAIYGELPGFDQGRYTFIAQYLPWVDGDGMEHRNSTILTRAAELPGDAVGVLGTVAHEFFHAWNIERIRPDDLEPFDFEAANVARELWFGEGFTSYYDDLAMARAGVLNVDQFAARTAGMVAGVVSQRGYRYYSPAEMSMQAPFVDAAVSVDPQNRRNTFISYYTWGSAIALALDLTLRRDFERPLDDLMRAMWSRHGRSFEPYTVEDIEVALASISDPAFARDFFDRFVRGRELPDFGPLLAEAGFLLRPVRPDQGALAGVFLQGGGDGALVAANTLIETGAYEAGIDRGDVIVSVASKPVRSMDDLRSALSGMRAGARVEVVWESRDGRHRDTIALDADPALEVVPMETAGIALGAEARSLREDWMGSKWMTVAGAR